MCMSKRAVIKLGGHLLFRNGILDTGYVAEFTRMLESASKYYSEIVVTVGGGEPARQYISWGRELSLNESALDRLGIMLSRVNAFILWSCYHGLPPPHIPSNLEDVLGSLRTWRVIFTGGFQPGQSTTTTSTLIAESINAEKLIIATDVDGVYDSDPKRNPGARKLDRVTVNRLEEILSTGYRAGEYQLLDRLSLVIIRRAKIPVIVVNGRPATNIERALAKGDVGTLVEPD